MTQGMSFVCKQLQAKDDLQNRGQTNDTSKNSSKIQKKWVVGPSKGTSSDYAAVDLRKESGNC